MYQKKCLKSTEVASNRLATHLEIMESREKYLMKKQKSGEFMKYCQSQGKFFCKCLRKC